MFPSCSDPAVFLTVLTWRHHKNMGLTCHPVLSAFLRGLWSFTSDVFLGHHSWVSHWKEVKTSSLKNVPSYIASSHVALTFFSILHSSVSRLPFVWNVAVSSFPFPDSWSELLSVWRSGQRGRRRWFNSHVTLSAWQRCRGASGKGFTHTHRTYIYIYAYTYRFTHK